MSEAPIVTIRTESLTKIYGERHIALNCIDLAVEKGSVLGVLGQNGAGKSTLTRLLLGLHSATAGRIWVLGKRMTPNAASVRRRMGYLSGNCQLPQSMTPIKYLEFVGKLMGLRRASRKQKLAQLLHAAGLLHVAGTAIRVLSGGMRTRLAIAASLINEPDVLVWDEPTQGLDPSARAELLALMKSLAGTKTLLVCSHHLADLEAICDSVIVLHQGQVIFRGRVDELKGSTKPNRVEIGLAGDRKVVADAVRTIHDLDDLENCSLNRSVLALELGNKASAATVLANVLITLADRKVEMTDLHICGSPAEKAIGELVLQEGRRGFTRAHQTVAE